MQVYKPLVSIIIPTYNRAHLIGETLDSVLAQSYQNWECIVVDDGSSDQTDIVMKAYCERDGRFQYYKRPGAHLPGGNGARNYGFKMSKGQFIQWFDSDDLMDTNYLSFKVENIQDNDLLITSGRKKDFKNNYEDLRMGFVKNHSLYKEIVTYESEILTQTVLFRRSILNGIDLFDETILRGQETEFLARLSYSHKFKFTFVDKKLYTYRLHPGSKSSQSQAIYLNSRMKYFLDNLDRALELGDNELIGRFYQKSMSTLFALIKIKDRRDFKAYIRNFYEILKKHDLKIRFVKALPFFGFMGFHSEKIRRYFINQIEQ